MGTNSAVRPGTSVAARGRGHHRAFSSLLACAFLFGAVRALAQPAADAIATPSRAGRVSCLCRKASGGALHRAVERDYDTPVSVLVSEEAAREDAEQAADRQAAIKPLRMLDIDKDARMPGSM